MAGHRHDHEHEGSLDPTAEARRLRDEEHELSERLAELRELNADLDQRLAAMTRALRHLGIELRLLEQERDGIDAERKRILEDVAVYRQQREDVERHLRDRG